MRVALVFVVILALATGHPEKREDNRVARSSTPTTISAYPFSVAVLYSWYETDFQLSAGGIILNQRSILTGAHNFVYMGCCVMSRWRTRVGSSYANSGGALHTPSEIFRHQYNSVTKDNDIAIMRLATFIDYIPNIVAPVGIAGENYTVSDNEPVWSTGWGVSESPEGNTVELHTLQIRTINKQICRRRYAILGWTVPDNLLCAGLLDNFDNWPIYYCDDQSTGSLVHNNVLIGITTLGEGCGPVFPGLFTNVSRYVEWIRVISNIN